MKPYTGRRHLKAKPFPSIQAAMKYAENNRARVTEMITHARGVRINIVLPNGKPKTLRVVREEA